MRNALSGDIRPDDPQLKRSAGPARTSSHSAHSRRGSALGKLIALFLAAPFVFLQPCAAAQSETAGKVVVVVANRLLLSDLANEDLPTLARMFHDGASALISPNCDGPKTEYSILLTAGSGISCRGGSYVRRFADANELLPDGTLASDVYTSRTGFTAPAGSAVFLGLGQAQRANSNSKSGVQLGACGDAIRGAGLVTCSVGNADIGPNHLDRSAAVLAMDSRGVVDVGNLGVSVLADDFGLSSDIDRLAAVLEDMRRADYVVVNFGDTTRLDTSKSHISNEAYAKHKSRALEGLDRFLGSLIAASEAEGTTFVLVSFSPPSPGRWRNLTPIVVYPAEESGLLMSATTRTAGLIAASDFAPTILSRLGLPRSDDMLGRPARSVASADSASVLSDMDARVSARASLMVPVLWVAAGLLMIFATAAGVLGIIRRSPLGWLVPAVKVGLLACASVPVAMLLAVLAPPGPAAHCLAVAAILALVITASLAVGRLMRARGKLPAAPMLFVFCITVLAVLIDGFAGGKLCRFALPCSYQLSGLRYYGVGNEYAGLLISMTAMTVLFIGTRAESSRRTMLLVGSAALAVVLSLGQSSFWANYGATAAAVVTTGLVGLSLHSGRFGVRHVALFLVAGAAIVVGFAVVDSWVSAASSSHAGRVASLFGSGKLGFVADVFVRKALMNLSIGASPQAHKALLLFSPFFVLWAAGVQRGVVEAVASDRRVAAGLKGILIGAFFAFLLNDSGIVIAGLMVAIVVLMLLYSLMEEVAARGGDSENVEVQDCQEL